jgi:FixJ family two-component response regulator
VIASLVIESRKVFSKREVLRLLAQGLTNAQIAESLVIDLVTVNPHMRSIYSKWMSPLERSRPATRWNTTCSKAAPTRERRFPGWAYGIR